MKCYICDRTLDEEQVQYNEEHGDYDPCPTCLAIIEEVFGDRPAAAEDDLTDDPLLDSLYPTVYDPFGEENP